MPIDPSTPVGPLGPARAISAIDARTLRQAAGERSSVAASSTPAALVSTSDALDPGPVPVDAERVTAIRKAIETGTYPLVPAKVADAIIAAGLLLRSPQ